MKGIRVMHFSLPFYNGGGLVKYVRDITEEQFKDDNIQYVGIMYTGDYTIFNKKPSIKLKKYNRNMDMIQINNFNPTTLFEGTLFPEKDIENVELEHSIIEILKKLNINLVHFHTFHGITSNLLKRLNENGIKSVYTAHDYQPICNRINLIDHNGNYCNNKKITCNICNKNALSNKKLYIRYSKLGNIIKDNVRIKNKIKTTISKFNREKSKEIQCNSELKLLENELYEKRINSFVVNFNKYINKIIYSSYITKNIYEDRGVIGKNSILLPISNKNLKNTLDDYDVNIDSEIISFGYLGGNRKEKGYEMMIEVFTQLYKDGITNWKLILLGSGSENIKIDESIRKNIVIKGHVKDNLYEEFEVLIIPSIWPETFNFVAIEGILNKKMIISSDIVGSSDLYKDSGIILYKHNNKNEFYDKVKQLLLSKNKTYDMQVEKNSNTNRIRFDQHHSEIIHLYREVLKDML